MSSGENREEHLLIVFGQGAASGSPYAWIWIL